MGVKTTCIETQKAKNRMSKKRIEERTTTPVIHAVLLLLRPPRPAYATV